MSNFTDEEIQKGEPLFLGVLGSRMDLKQEKILELIMATLEELERPPDQIILPAEGTSSIFISDWADSLKIPTQIYEADWRRHQRRAKIYRDSRIQKESTHFLVFLNKRSEFNEKLADRLCRQGRTVFTVSYADAEIMKLIGETSLPEQLLQKEEHGSKRGTGKAQGSRQLTLLEDLGSQCLLIDP